MSTKALAVIVLLAAIGGAAATWGITRPDRLQGELEASAARLDTLEFERRALGLMLLETQQRADSLQAVADTLAAHLEPAIQYIESHAHRIDAAGRAELRSILLGAGAGR